MARFYLALALLALLVGNAAAFPSLGAGAPTPFPVEVAPGSLPELPLVPDVTGKYLAKVSGVRVIISGIRDKVEEAVGSVTDGIDA